jgi:hypothetical protein
MTMIYSDQWQNSPKNHLNLSRNTHSKDYSNLVSEVFLSKLTHLQHNPHRQAVTPSISSVCKSGDPHLQLSLSFSLIPASEAICLVLDPSRLLHSNLSPSRLRTLVLGQTWWDSAYHLLHLSKFLSISRQILEVVSTSVVHLYRILLPPRILHKIISDSPSEDLLPLQHSSRLLPLATLGSNR